MAAVKEKMVTRAFDQRTITAAVKEHYRKMRSRQTYDYVQRMKAKYLTFDKPMFIWEALEHLNELLDASDPDLSLSNIQHSLQTAEAIRADERPGWMQLVGLIHELGKVLYLWGSDEDGTSTDEQWGLVGDVFAVGCQLPDTCVYPMFNDLNPDMQDERYNTPLGIYEAECGLDKMTLNWGHNEYLYQVLKNHSGNRIPEAGMVMIRYHSFYPWHTGGSYAELTNEIDEQYKEWILDFHNYDLCAKCPKHYDLEEMKAYYGPLVKKYLGEGPIYW